MKRMLRPILWMSVVALGVLALTVGGWWFTAQLHEALAASEQNRMLAEANAAVATAERERATAGFQKGLETIDDLIINLDGRLAQKSGMGSVRIEFLREFLNYSQRLQAERPNDPVARRQIRLRRLRLGQDLRPQIRREGSQGDLERSDPHAKVAGDHVRG